MFFFVFFVCFFFCLFVVFFVFFFVCLLFFFFFFFFYIKMGFTGVFISRSCFPDEMCVNYIHLSNQPRLKNG